MHDHGGSDGSEVSHNHGKFQIEVPDGDPLSRGAMLEHVEHGAMVVDGVTVGPHDKEVTLSAERGNAALQLTADELRDLWGEELHADPIELHEQNPRVEVKGIREPDADHNISVDLTVEGDSTNNIEVAALYAKNHIVRVLQALDEDADPADMEGDGNSFEWGRIHESREDNST